jgi:hypothetical protein
MATPSGADPVAKSTLGAKELVVIEPETLVFLKTETVLLISFITTRSGLPSPSKSHIATPSGYEPVVKSTFEAKELAVMEPETLVFLKTETVLLPVFVTTKSGLPSPSKSPIAILPGVVPAAKLVIDANDDVSMLFELGKVAINGEFAYAVNPVVISVTEIGTYVEPIGTVTASEVELAETTAAFTAPKYTTSFAGAASKPVPMMVTVVPNGPSVGVKEEIVGTETVVALA